ncbi:MAG: phosphopantetheine-binding protein [Acidimicrobiia bacterium]
MTTERAVAFAWFREAAATILHVPAENIRESSRFREDLMATSLDVIELVIALEDRLGTQLPIEALVGAETVGEALDRVFEDPTDPGPLSGSGDG